MFIFWNKNQKDKARIIKQSWDIAENEKVAMERYDYLEIEDVPQPEDNCMLATLYINPLTKELWYEYEEIITHESELEQRIADLEFALAEGMEVIA